METTVICALVLGTIFGVQSAHSCRIPQYPVAYKSDHVILVGRISAYREQLTDSGPVIGFGIEPVIVFGRSDLSSLSALTVVPVQLDISCALVGLYPSRERIEQYAIGRLVGLHAGLYNNEELDVMYGLPHFSLEEIHESCDLQVVGQSQGDWNVPRQCGSSYFHARAVAAALSVGSAQEVDQSLKRLATYPGPIRYEELVNRFILNKARGQELIAIRYGDLTHESCRKSTSNPDGSRQEIVLYQEFCEYSREKWHDTSSTDTYQ